MRRSVPVIAGRSSGRHRGEGDAEGLDAFVFKIFQKEGLQPFTLDESAGKYGEGAVVEKILRHNFHRGELEVHHGTVVAIKGADEASHGGAGHDVNGDVLLFEHAQDPHLREAARPAPAQGDPHFGNARRRERLRLGAGPQKQAGCRDCDVH